MKIHCIILLSIIQTIFSQETPVTSTLSSTSSSATPEPSPTPSPDYPVDKTFYHCDESRTSGYKIGEPVFFCIHFVPRNYRIAFNITVDNYEVLTVSGAYIYSQTDTVNKQEIIAQFSNVTVPYPAVYMEKAAKEVTLLFNVVIKLNKGNIEDVVWDNECWSCGFTEGCKEHKDIISLRNATELFSESVFFFN